MRGYRGQDWFRTARRVARYVAALIAVLIVVSMAYMAYDYARDEADEFFDDPVKQFKYGSTGGDRLAGIPSGIFKALPELCRDYLPGEGWQSLGFIFEDGMDRPIGTSKRHHLGFHRIRLNCPVCHVGTYRTNAESRPMVVAGMPANRSVLARFAQVLTSSALDEPYTPSPVSP